LGGVAGEPKEHVWNCNPCRSEDRPLQRRTQEHSPFGTQGKQE
jgi:hypothetical protein